MSAPQTPAKGQEGLSVPPSTAKHLRSYALENTPRAENLPVLVENQLRVLLKNHMVSVGHALRIYQIIEEEAERQGIRHKKLQAASFIVTPVLKKHTSKDQDEDSSNDEFDLSAPITTTNPFTDLHKAEAIKAKRAAKANIEEAETALKEDSKGGETADLTNGMDLTALGLSESSDDETITAIPTSDRGGRGGGRGGRGARRGRGSRVGSVGGALDESKQVLTKEGEGGKPQVIVPEKPRLKSAAKNQKKGKASKSKATIKSNAELTATPKDKSSKSKGRKKTEKTEEPVAEEADVAENKEKLPADEKRKADDAPSELRRSKRIKN